MGCRYRCWCLSLSLTVRLAGSGVVVGVSVSLVGDRQAKKGVDSRLVGKWKCCLVEAVVGRSDSQQQYYL